MENAAMERARIVKDDITEEGSHFLSVYVEAKNSCLILLSENEDKLGTLAIAVPKPKDLLGSPSSSVLIGDKNSVSARLFAEYMAGRKGKIALVSIYLESMSEARAQSVLKKLVEKALAGETQKEAVAT
jgi:hypothetical protein